MGIFCCLVKGCRNVDDDDDDDVIIFGDCVEWILEFDWDLNMNGRVVVVFLFGLSL